MNLVEIVEFGIRRPARAGRRSRRQKSAGGGAPAFDPTQVAGLKYWGDVSDAANRTIVSGKVSALADKSGNGNNYTQGTAVARPVLNAAAINGLDTMTHAAGVYLVGPAISVVFTASAFSIYYVSKVTSITATAVGEQLDAGVGENGGYVEFGLATVAGTRKLGCNIYDGADKPDSVTGPALNAAFCAAVRFGGGTIKTRLNGAAESAGSASGNIQAAGLSGLTNVGGGQSSTHNPKGDLGETILYNVKVSDADDALIRGYLSTKWGLGF